MTCMQCVCSCLHITYYLMSWPEQHSICVQLGFIPKMWQPSFPDVPQIPYTFTPRQNPVKRRGRKGNTPRVQLQAQVNLCILIMLSVISSA